MCWWNLAMLRHRSGMVRCWGWGGAGWVGAAMFMHMFIHYWLHITAMSLAVPNTLARHVTGTVLGVRWGGLGWGSDVHVHVRIYITDFTQPHWLHITATSLAVPWGRSWLKTMCSKIALASSQRFGNQKNPHSVRAHVPKKQHKHLCLWFYDAFCTTKIKISPWWKPHFLIIVGRWKIRRDMYEKDEIMFAHTPGPSSSAKIPDNLCSANSQPGT